MTRGDRVRVKATGECGRVNNVAVGPKRVNVWVVVDGAVGNPWPFDPAELEPE